MRIIHTACSAELTFHQNPLEESWKCNLVKSAKCLKRNLCYLVIREATVSLSCMNDNVVIHRTMLIVSFAYVHISVD